MKVWELPEYRYGIYKKFVAINYNPKAPPRTRRKGGANHEQI
jgi:hypothetical protein